MKKLKSTMLVATGMAMAFGAGYLMKDKKKQMQVKKALDGMMNSMTNN